MIKLITIFAFFGACVGTDWHDEQTCQAPSSGGFHSTTCEAACVDVTPQSEASGPLCTSKLGQCHSITTSDGTAGCCATDVTDGAWRFYECE